MRSSSDEFGQCEKIILDGGHSIDPFANLSQRMPMRVPDGQADAAARFSVGSFRRNASWRPHAAPLMVTVATTDRAQAATPEATTTFTRIIAALAETNGAVGMYWGSGHVAHDASCFCAPAADAALPITLWSGVSLARTTTSVSLLTTGLRRFTRPSSW
jgi:hypothetical protein